jgi:D-alanine-D-alanine ligase
MKISVLMGGTSSERDVSLASGLRVAEALRAKGHEVTTVDTARGALPREEERAMLAASAVQKEPPSQEELDRMKADTHPQLQAILPLVQDADVVFLTLHGGYGEDGTVQAFLDMAGVPYTGSGHLASALAMDTDLSKHLFRREGVSTAEWMMVERAGGASAEVMQEAIATLGLPLIVKPSKQGSTVGLSVVKEPSALEPAIREAFRYDDEVMLERFIAGRELTVGVLGDETLPVGEIIAKHEIYDYECKYTPGMAVEEFPAKLTDDETATVQRFAQLAFEALKLRGYARIDFRMATDGTFYCLEANTLPGMTQTSLIPQAAAAAGITFPELCDRIVQLALEGRGGK